MTPKLYRVSVTYEVLVAAMTREGASPPAKAICPPGDTAGVVDASGGP